MRVRLPLAKPQTLRRHLPIAICRRAILVTRSAQNRIREVCAPFVLVRGQSRSSTAIEYPNRFGRRGFDSHRARNFRRAVEFGLSVKRETASAFKPRTIGQPMDSQLASL